MTPFGLIAPARILMGRGCRQEAAPLVANMSQRAVVVHSRSVPWAPMLLDALEARDVTCLPCHPEGEPSLPQVEALLAELRPHRPDCVVALGGGAAIDLGKALSALLPADTPLMHHLEVVGDGQSIGPDPLPFVALPSTAGTGAEATKNAVISVPEAQVKVSLRDARMVPDLAIIDPALTDHLPQAVTLATGLDAVTQLIESYLSIRANPLTDALCRDAAPAAMAALVRLMEGEDPAARDALARGSFFSGIALANSGLGIVHGLAAVIGGRGGAHGAICGRLLPAALEVNRATAETQGQPLDRFDEVTGWIATALDVAPQEALPALRRFIDGHGLPSLDDLHCPADGFGRIATDAAAASSTKGNPVPLAQGDIVELLQRSA